jgi:hypothetical protein
VRLHIFVIVNVPFPVHPVEPVNVQFPLTLFPFTVPASVKVFPAGDFDCTINPSFPLKFPLKFPVAPNVPLAVSPETKQAEFVVKLKFVTDRIPFPCEVKLVPKVNAVVPPEPTSMAFQVPLMLDELDPQPTAKRVNAIKPTANHFMDLPPNAEIRKWRHSSSFGIVPRPEPLQELETR